MSVGERVVLLSREVLKEKAFLAARHGVFTTWIVSEIGWENLELLLMEEILHQLLDTVVYPTIYSVWYIPGGAGFLPSTVCASKYALMIQKSYAFWAPEMEMLCFTSSVCGFKLNWYRTEIGWLDSWTISAMI